MCSGILDPIEAREGIGDGPLEVNEVIDEFPAGTLQSRSYAKNCRLALSVAERGAQELNDVTQAGRSAKSLHCDGHC